MKGKKFLVLLSIMALTTMVAADQTWSQVFWYTAASVAHTIRYAIYNTSVACDQTHLFYVDGITGSMKKINASSDKTGVYHCQNDTQGAFTIENSGSVPKAINASFDQVTAGVTMKIGNADGGWQGACTGVCNVTACDFTSDCVMVNVTSVQIAYSIPQNGSQEYWMWADFNKVAGTVEPTKGNMTTDAVQSV